MSDGAAGFTIEVDGAYVLMAKAILAGCDECPGTAFVPLHRDVGMKPIRVVVHSSDCAWAHEHMPDGAASDIDDESIRTIHLLTSHLEIE